MKFVRFLKCVLVILLCVGCQSEAKTYNISVFNDTKEELENVVVHSANNQFRFGWLGSKIDANRLMESAQLEKGKLSISYELNGKKKSYKLPLKDDYWDKTIVIKIKADKCEISLEDD